MEGHALAESDSVRDSLEHSPLLTTATILTADDGAVTSRSSSLRPADDGQEITEQDAAEEEDGFTTPPPSVLGVRPFISLPVPRSSWCREPLRATTMCSPARTETREDALRKYEAGDCTGTGGKRKRICGPELPG